MSDQSDEQAQQEANVQEARDTGSMLVWFIIIVVCSFTELFFLLLNSCLSSDRTSCQPGKSVLQCGL